MPKLHGLVKTMTKKITKILSYFEQLFPLAGCELNYRKDYELVIAVMLSAQCSDNKVNVATAVLFDLYPSLESLKNASLNDVEKLIRPLGMSQRKALYTIEIAEKILADFNGKVPSDRELLMSLPGVGNKTANVVRAELFHIPELPVDTHVERISKRLNIVSRNDNVFQVEQKLKKIIPVDKQIKTHHQMIHFGRYFCKARKPNCGNCAIKDLCNYENK